MKVLLAEPPGRYAGVGVSSVQVHPLGLGYLAAALAPHHDVVQLIPDVRAFPDDGARWAAIAEALRAEAPDLVGVSLVTATFPAGRRLAALARSLLGPHVPIVAGGVHATFRPAEVLAEPAFDGLVVGEGEETLREVAAAVERGRPWDHVPGVVTRAEGGDADALVWAPPRGPVADLDTLPDPRREGILWPDHLQPAFYQSLITVRGCPYRCSYCSVPQSSHRRTRYRSAGHVAREMVALVERWKVPYLFFHDSVFTLNRRRTLALCDELQDRGLRVPFACQTRADRVDPELLARLARAGCHQIFLGLESGHPETLRRIHKDVSLDVARRAVRDIKAAGIRCTGFFMVGFPWETREHVEATVELATTSGLDAATLFSATPLPGTELWEQTRGVVLPPSIDFRAPELNLTALPDAEYGRLFAAARARVDAYNQSQMEAQVEAAAAAWREAREPPQPGAE